MQKNGLKYGPDISQSESAEGNFCHSDLLSFFAAANIFRICGRKSLLPLVSCC